MDSQSRGRFLDGFIDVYVDRPCACCSACSLALFMLAVLSIGAGMMGIEQKEGAWDVWDGTATRWNEAYNLAVQAAWQSGDSREFYTVSGGRRLVGGGSQGRRDRAAGVVGGFLPPLPRPQSSLAARGPPRQTHREAEATAAGAGAPAGERRAQGEELVGLHLDLYYKANEDATGTVFTPEMIQEMCKVEATMKATMKLGGVVDYYDSPVALFYGENATHYDPDFAKDFAANYAWDCALLSQASVDATVAVLSGSIARAGPRSRFARLVHRSFAETGQTAYTRTYMYSWLKEADVADLDLPIRQYLGREYGFFQDGLYHSSAYMGGDDRFLESGPLRVRIFNSGVDEFENMVAWDFLPAFGSIIFVWVVMALHLSSAFLASCAMFQVMMSLPIACIFYRMFQIDYFEFLHVLIVYLVLGIGADDVFVFFDTFRHVSKDIAPVEVGGAYERHVLHRVIRKTFIRTSSAIFNTSFTTAVAFLSCSVSKVMPMRTCGYYAAICIVLNYIFTITLTPAYVAIWHYRIQGKRCCCPNWSLRPQAELAQTGTAPAAQNGGFIEAALDKVYIPMMQKKVGSIRPVPLVIALTMLGVAVQGVYFTSQLSPPRKEEVWFPSNHMSLDLTEFRAENFYQTAYDNYAVISVFWGIQGFDDTFIDIYNPDAGGGKVIFDPAFDLSTAEAQQAVFDVCDQLQKLQCNLRGCLNAGYDTLMYQSDKKSHSCFLEDFQAWNGGTLPTGQDFEPKLLQFRSSADKTNTSEVLEDEVDYREDIGFVDGKLRYVTIKIRTTMATDTPFSKGIEIRDLLQDWTEAKLAEMPASLKSMKYHGDGIFRRFDLAEELLAGLFSGCAIAAPMAFLVLLASTMNIVIAVYAVLSVGAIVFCVLGFCKSAMDWDLGVGEAIAGIIVIGYSVDYVVHLAHIYCEAKSHGCRTRAEQAEFAVRNMGSTVFAGAVTTAGSGSIMFICFFYFFFKMALLITVTIVYSFLFSLGFFMSVVWLIGPEGSFGNIPLPKSIRSRGSIAEQPPVSDAASAPVEECTAEAEEGGRGKEDLTHGEVREVSV